MISKQVRGCGVPESLCCLCNSDRKTTGLLLHLSTGLGMALIIHLYFFQGSTKTAINCDKSLQNKFTFWVRSVDTLFSKKAKMKG